MSAQEYISVANKCFTMYSVHGIYKMGT